MTTAYFSIVLDHPADEVWRTIRPFGHYSWAGVSGETVIEDSKASDQVGAVRRVTTAGGTIRQVLLAHSDVERSYTYTFCGTPPFPVHDYVATIRVTPVAEDGRSFVEWRAGFDCAAEERDHWTNHFEREGFARWLAALRRYMEGGEHSRTRC